jgi:sodium transport system permease protein
MVTAFSLSSAFAKTTKEAALIALPVDLIIIFCAFVPVLTGGSPGLWYHYFIPFYNSVRCINDILTFNVDGLRILQSALANCALSGAGILLLARMFDSERIMFQ